MLLNCQFITIFRLICSFKKVSFRIIQGRQHWGGRGGHAPPSSPSPFFFCVAKRKKGDKSKKERVSKQKLLKGYHQGQNIIVLAILERLEFESFSCRPTILFSVPWPPHFEIHFAGPVIMIIYYIFCDIIK